MHPRRASLAGVHLIGVRLIGVYLSRRSSLTGVHLAGVRPAKPCQAYPSKGILVSLGLRDLEDLQLEVYVRDTCD
jgi:hypothetical protein